MTGSLAKEKNSVVENQHFQSPISYKTILSNTPLKSYRILYEIISNLFDGKIKIDYLKILENKYINLLNEIKKNSEYSFYGSLLQDNRNDFVKRLDGLKEIKIFNLKSIR